MSNLTWIGIAIAAAIVLFTPAIRLVIAAVAGRGIGARSLSRQPDTIHLDATGTEKWGSNPNWAASVAELERLGFQTSGIYTVVELPGVVVRLMTQSRDNVSAALYEHPTAGHWFSLTSHHADGGSMTMTSLRATGLDARPGHPVVHAPGTSASALFARLLAERPATPALPANVQNAVEVFERAWQEGMAWRKAHGVSRVEVMKVAVNRPGRKRAA